MTVTKVCERGSQTECKGREVDMEKIATIYPRVEFDNKTQRWTVEIDGEIVGDADTREGALRFEAFVLNLRMQEGV